MTDKKEKNIISAVLGVLLAVILTLLSSRIINGDDASKRGYDVVIFGDSIIAYTQDDTSVANMLSEKTGLSIGDFSFGGTLLSFNAENGTLGSRKNYLCLASITQSLLADDFSIQKNANTTDPATDYFDERVAELENLDLKDTDVVIIEHCLNDYHCAIPIGDENSTSEYTYCGALRLSVENIRKINPDIRVIFASPTEKWMMDGTNGSEFDYGGGTLDEYVNAQRKMAEVLGAEYVDMYGLYDTASDVFLDSEGRPVEGYAYTVEGTHPNYYGREAISSLLAGYLSGTSSR